jgi:hypothetical protein
MTEIAVKPKYDEYVAYLESKGWRREQLTLDELNTNIVTLREVAANASTWAIDIRAPAGQKITIMGTQQVPAGADARTAHAFRIRFADSSENELAFNTKIKITKEKSSEATVPLARIFYADINLTKQPGNQGGVAAGSSPVTYKTDLEWFRFKQGVELNGEQKLRVYIINTLGTVAAAQVAAPQNIPTTNMRFALDCDLWTREE